MHEAHRPRCPHCGERTLRRIRTGRIDDEAEVGKLASGSPDPEGTLIAVQVWQCDTSGKRFKAETRLIGEIGKSYIARADQGYTPE